MKSLTLFVIHSPRIKYREKCILGTTTLIKNVCHQKNIECNIVNIQNHESNDIKPNLSELDKSISYEKTGLDLFDRVMKPLNVEQLSNFFKQKEALTQIVQLNSLPNKGSDDYYMIIEDDAYVLNEFQHNLLLLFDVIQKDTWDILTLSVSSSTNKELVLQNTRDVVNILPSKEAYMIKPEIAKELLNNLQIIRLPYRYQLSYWIKMNPKYEIKYFTQRVFIEGSKIGFVPSTTCENNVLVYNQEFMEIFNMITGNKEYNFERVKQLYKIVEKLQSPEIMHLYGVILHRENKFSHARDIFTDAVEQMVSKDGLINPRSELLNNTINMYGLYQDDLSNLTAKPSKYKKVNFI